MKGWKDNWFWYVVIISTFVVFSLSLYSMSTRELSKKANKTYVDIKDSIILNTVIIRSDSMIKIGNKTNELLEKISNDGRRY